MFSIKGWSVDTSTLKKEPLTVSTIVAATVAAESSRLAAPVKKPRKRKRASEKSHPEVTADNVADLYEKVIVNKEFVASGVNKGALGERKKRIKNKNEVNKEDVRYKDEVKPEGEPKAKKQKENNKGNKTKPESDTPSTNISTPSTTPAAAPLSPLPSALAKLTPLQRAMRAKLIPARFRHLNETLYTRPSTEALSLFKQTPSLFEEYHAGFRQQVEVWPENPVDKYLSLLKSRAAVRTPYKPRAGNGRPDYVKLIYKSLSETPLPRTQGVSVIADLGCGDAKLAQALQFDKDKLKLYIHSFDLHSPDPLITAADIANLPLPDGSIDVAIFCLALMGTNWLDFIDEAYRILHWKGELWISEIKSRFSRIGRTTSGAPPGRNIVSHSVGHRKKGAAKKMTKEEKDTEAERHRKELAVVVDGEEDRKGETDVSAFVAALEKRGFLLQGEPKNAIDMSNKMFVGMHFIKLAPPTVGKNVEKYGKKDAKPKKFIPGAKEAEAEIDENILKPCVYKLR